jgi:hypothetical protein
MLPFLNSHLRSISVLPLLLLIGCGGEKTGTNPPVAVQSSSPEVTPPAAAPSTPATQPAANLSQSTAPVDPTAAPVIDASGKVSLANGRVSFTLPAGFTPMTAEEIALKFPRRSGNQPQYVFANDRRKVAISVTFSSSRVTPSQLPELKTFIQRSITQTLPDTQWLTQEMTTINQAAWAHLEFISRAVDTQIHNNTYLTSFNGKMLGFNFNSTIGQYNAVKPELNKTRDSIVISQ